MLAIFYVSRKAPWLSEDLNVDKRECDRITAQLDSEN